MLLLTSNGDDDRNDSCQYCNDAQGGNLLRLAAHLHALNLQTRSLPETVARQCREFSNNLRLVEIQVGRKVTDQNVCDEIAVRSGDDFLTREREEVSAR